MGGGLVRFTVLGTPVPQGSKSAFVVKGRAVIAEANRARLMPYRAAVAAAAAEAMDGRAQLAGPLRLHLWLGFPRPKAHYRTGSHAGELRADAPAYVATRPDASKVVRAVEDALTGIVYHDDAQLAVLVVSKHYADQPATVVDVSALNGADDA